MSEFLNEVVKMTKEKRALDQIVGKIKYEMKLAAIAGKSTVSFKHPDKDVLSNVVKTFKNLGLEVVYQDCEEGVCISWEHKL